MSEVLSGGQDAARLGREVRTHLSSVAGDGFSTRPNQSYPDSLERVVSNSSSSRRRTVRSVWTGPDASEKPSANTRLDPVLTSKVDRTRSGRSGPRALTAAALQERSHGEA